MLIDRVINQVDTALRTLFAPAATRRGYPDAEVAETALTEADKAHALGLMRINHVGEICAQALYAGQALTAREDTHRAALEEAAHEETEHLAWTQKRIHELGGRPSVLNPLWYGASWALGVGAGLLGDRWNLGFLEETEHQVSAHLDSHLGTLPEADAKSRAIVTQMREDEQKHAQMARSFGAAQLPAPIKEGMKLGSKIMTSVSYYW